MIELKDMEQVCCGKKMHYIDNAQNMLDPNGYIQSWTCLECGNFITLTESQLDDEELENYNENYGEDDTEGCC